MTHEDASMIADAISFGFAVVVFVIGSAVSLGAYVIASAINSKKDHP